MSYTTVDTSNPTGNYDFEACDRINEGEARAGTRAGFDGWLQDAPGCSTSVVNGLSQQLIHQMNLILPDALVSFDELEVELEEAAFPSYNLKLSRGFSKQFRSEASKCR